MPEASDMVHDLPGFALNILEKIGSPQAIAEIEKGLSSSDEWVRKSAKIVLERVKDKKGGGTK